MSGVPCNNTSSIVYQTTVLFIIPFLASIYCLMQLFYRGLMGFEKMFDLKDMEHSSKLKQVFICGVIWFLFFILIVPSFNYFVYRKFENREIII